MTTPLALLAVSTVKASIVLMLTLGVTSLLRRKSAALRHAIWTAGLLCALAVPVLGLMLPAWHLNLEQNPRTETPHPATVQTPERTEPTTIAALSRETTRPSTRNILPSSRAILLLWLCGLAVVAMKLSIEFSKLAWLAFGATPVRQESWKSLVREVSLRIQLKRVARLLCNPNASVLGTWGMLRPRIILPARSRNVDQ
jgi:beta-lactamase regulating signal transducer with metallopeptidase domain